jgi:hypothetical protein
MLAARASADKDEEVDAVPAPQTKKSEEQLIAAQVTAHSRDGGVFVRYGVLKLDTENPKGYAVLDWQRGTLDAGD